MKKLALKELDSLFAAIAAQQALYLPQDDAAGQAQFAPWKEGTALSKRLNTARSAKDLFFPQVENLAGFKREGKSIEIFETREDVRPFTVFGVRACDARSFEILDKVFLKEPVDTFYASRREMGTVITLACTKPDETCFCQSFGIDPANPAGDVSCWMDEENLYWKANTAKGETLTSELPMLEDGGEEAVKARQEKLHAILKQLPLSKLDLSKVGAGKTEVLFNGRSGRACLKAALAAVPARSCARPANATMCRSSTPAKPSGASAAGTAVCTPTLPKCRPVNRDPRSSSASGSVLCTSWSISRTITTVSLAASAADGVCRSVRFTRIL